jgi:4-amino-4-deoxy-L-arabinose transferase-like glycosyltransferase
MDGTRPKNKFEELNEMTRQPPKKDLPKYFYVLPFLHLVIALPFAWYLNIWADEGSTLYTTRDGFFQALQNTLWDEKQAPLYFLVLSLWREISDAVFWARLFSILCSLLSIVVFYKLVRKFWNERTALFAGFFFAIHPYLIFASLEIRVYSLIILLALLLTKFFFDGYLERRENQLVQKRKIRNTQILFILTAIVALYTNYYLGFWLVGFFVVLLVLKRWKPAKRYFLQMLIVGAAILPLLWAIKLQFAVNTGGHFQETNAVEGIKLLWNHFLTFVLPTEIYTPEDQSWFSFIRVWLVRLAGPAVLILLLVKRRLFEGKVLIFGTLTAVIFGFLYFAYFMLGELYIEIRHAAVWFPSVCLLLVACLTGVLTQRREDAEDFKGVYAAAVGVLLLVFYVYGIYALYPEGVKRGDWERVAEYIERNEKPDQPIVVFSNYEALNLPVYYDGKNKVLPDENFFKWNYEAEFGTEGTWTKQIAYVISTIPEDAEEIWLVTEEGCRTTRGCAPLEKFVKENYTVIAAKDFYRERVLLLRKK